ncbi:hypothetical protein AQUCO_04700070v1 [Aquilegia coerulea]|uniref:CRIB domain-containing protein n=1 Tax=Aquilegia coerulea TaxID=218851 RepID=A0A2G5CL16_AQUCA|nr:hypothetical protein AQUCO_04700070v1 [Aquilegia coerulea]PIA31948.1 hypothetical protein AQUCO_04700070v1 [Aquilegia coerulea]
MAKMKGIYKGFKYISNIFVVKEQREMEIGYPTDVKHVAHIGWDGQSNDSAPSWMKEFKAASDFSTKSVNELGGSRNAKSSVVPSWSSRDLEESMGVPQTSSLTERSKKKQKRKKVKSATSSPKSSSTSKASRSAKSKPSFAKSVSQAQASPSLHGILLQ